MSPPPLHLEIDAQSWPVQSGDVIGRFGTVATEVLKNCDLISRRHLQIDLSQGAWTITLFPNARNVTSLNGKQLNPGETALLSNFNEVAIHTFTFHLRQSQPETRAPTLSAHPIPLLTIDSMLQVHSLNEAATRLFPEPLQAGDLLTPHLIPTSAVKLRQVLEQLPNQQNSVSFDLEYLKSGSQTGIQRAIVRHEAPSYLLVLQDITNSLHNEENLRHHQQSLVEQLKTLTKLISTPSLPQGDLPAFLPLLAQLTADLIPNSRVTVAFQPTTPPTAETEQCNAHTLPAITAGYTSTNNDSDSETPTWSASASNLDLQIRVPTGQAWSPIDEQYAKLTTKILELGHQVHQQAEELQRHRDREESLKFEFAQASNYLSRLLPAPLDSSSTAVQTQWEYHPSGALGGDVFGYDWLDEDHFYAYVADVAGHGIGAALLAVSLVNHLRLAIQRNETWLRDPGLWLQHLNKTFPMEQHGGLTWTLWCGIYHPRKRQLHYSSGGHPPAILINNNLVGHLSTNGPVLGALPDLEFNTAKVQLSPGAKLFLYTDGVFEFSLSDGSIGSIEQFTETVASTASMTQGECSYLHRHAAALCGTSNFPDDFTLLSLRFP